MSLTDLEWALAPGSGMAALVLLSVVVALGLALSLRMASDAWPRVLTTAGHRQLTNLALLMTGLHLAMLLLDADAAMSVADLVIPFLSGYRPVATVLAGLVVGMLFAARIAASRRRPEPAPAPAPAHPSAAGGLPPLPARVAPRPPGSLSPSLDPSSSAAVAVRWRP